MGAQGFSRHVIEVIKNNRALLPSQNRTKDQGGNHPDGKKPLKFRKASNSQKKTIYYNKEKIQKQIRFRVGLLMVVIIFVFLLVILFLSFG